MRKRSEDISVRLIMYNPNLTLVKCDYSLREKEDG